MHYLLQSNITMGNALQHLIMVDMKRNGTLELLRVVAR